MMSCALSSSRRYAFGLVEGVDWICTHDASASTAFRNCTHMISLHIASLFSRGLMARLTWPQGF